MEGTDELESRVSFVGKQPMETPQWKPIDKNNGRGHLLQMTVKFDRSAGSGDEDVIRIVELTLVTTKGKPFLESPQLHIGNSGNLFFFCCIHGQKQQRSKNFSNPLNPFTTGDPPGRTFRLIFLKVVSKATFTFAMLCGAKRRRIFLIHSIEKNCFD